MVERARICSSVFGFVSQVLDLHLGWKRVGRGEPEPVKRREKRDRGLSCPKCIRFNFAVEQQPGNLSISQILSLEHAPISEEMLWTMQIKKINPKLSLKA